MSRRAHLTPILHDDRITRGLDDAEARLLIDWLVARAETMKTASEVRRLCLRARSIARFVVLWCHAGLAGAALQLAATERFACPLPTQRMDACDLMQAILDWE
jgi:hypothetical protein